MGRLKTILLWMTGLILVRWVWLIYKFIFVSAARLVSGGNRVLQERTALNRRLEKTVAEIAQPINEAIQRKWATQQEEWRAEAEREVAGMEEGDMTDDQSDELQKLKAEIAALRTASGGAGTLLPKAAIQSLLAMGVVLCIAGLAFLVLASSGIEDWQYPFLMVTLLFLGLACIPLIFYGDEVTQAQERRKVKWDYENLEAIEASQGLRQREAETEAYETEAVVLNASARHAQAHARMADLEAERAKNAPKEIEATEPRRTKRAICTYCNHINYAAASGIPGQRVGYFANNRCSSCREDAALVYDG